MTETIVSPIPRLALTQTEACAALGCSEEFFVEHIRPHVRAVRGGRKRIYPLPGLAALVGHLHELTPAKLIYLIRVGEDGPVKIGSAGSYRKVLLRLGKLQTGNHEQLRLCGTLAETDRVTEGHLHQRFARHRLRGEWFEPADAIFEYFAEHANSEVLGS